MFFKVGAVKDISFEMHREMNLQHIYIMKIQFIQIQVFGLLY